MTGHPLNLARRAEGDAIALPDDDTGVCPRLVRLDTDGARFEHRPGCAGGGALAKPSGVPDCPRALRVQIDAADVADGILLLFARLVLPTDRVAANHVDEPAQLLRAAASQQQHVGPRVGWQGVELGALRTPADKIDDRDLIDPKCLLFAVAAAQVELAVDQVLA